MRSLLFAVAIALCSGAQAPQSALPSGPYEALRIVPDPGFGAKTEWDSIFKMGTDVWTAFRPDGSFFRTAWADGLVHEFDAAGNLVKTFGRRGQGPGDLQMPGALDVLDGKTLVVNDGGNRRLSLFDMEGHFLKTVKIGEGGGPTISVMTLVAIDGNKIACTLYEGRDAPEGVIAARYRVLVKDLESGRETELAVFDWEKPRSKFMVRVMEWEPAVTLAKAGPGRVLVACSGSPEIAVYSSSGQKLSSFRLATERTRTEWKHLEFAMNADRDPKSFSFVARNRADIKLIEYLPYFSRLALDAAGTVLVYDFNAARFSRDVSFQAFSLDGRLLASAKIDLAGYDPVMPLHFWKDFAYGYLTKTGGDEAFAFSRFKLEASRSDR